MPHDISTEELGRRITDQFADFLIWKLGQPTRKHGSEWQYSTENYKIEVGSAKHGVWLHYAGDEGGHGPLTLLHHINGGNWRQAYNDARAFLGIDAGSYTRKTPTKAEIEQREKKRQDNARRIANEQFKKIESARKLWNQGRAIEGTVAETYLQQSRGIKGQIPGADVVRYLPSFFNSDLNQSFPAIAFAVTDATGDFTGFQAIYLTTEGKKLQRTYTKNGKTKEVVAKRSRGVLKGRAVRLRAGREGAPVVFTEGPEDGLTAYTTTPDDYGVFVLLGAMSRAQNFTGFTKSDEFILAAQNDAATSDVAKLLQEAIEAMDEAGAIVRIAETPAAAGKDINDLLRAQGPQAVTDALTGALPWRLAQNKAEARQEAKNPFSRNIHGVEEIDTEGLDALPEQLTKIDARARLKVLMADAINQPKFDTVPVIEADTGAGKSTAALETLAAKFACRNAPGFDNEGQTRVLYVVPDTKRQPDGETPSLGQQIEADGLALGLNIALYQGRNEQSCPNIDVVRPLQSAGIRASGVCGDEAGTTGVDACKYRDVCPYIAQKSHVRQADVIIIPHSMLSIDWQYTPLKDLFFELIIIDESFANSVARSVTIQADRLRTAAPTKTQHLGRIRNKEEQTEADMLNADRVKINQAIIHALETDQDPATYIFMSPELTAKLETAIEAIEDNLTPEGEISPNLTAKGARAIADRLRQAGSMTERRMFKIISERVQTILKGQPLLENRQITLEQAEDNAGNARQFVRVSWTPESFNANMRTPMGMERAVMVLDATAKRPILEMLFPTRKLQWHQIAVKTPFTQIIQAPERSYATTNLVGRLNDIDSQVKGAGVLNDLMKTIDTMSARHPGGVLVVTAKKAREAIEAAKRGAGRSFPQNVSFAHFGALRGKNAWKSFEAVMIIGRQQPYHTDIDGLAVALASNAGQSSNTVTGLEPLGGTYRTKTQAFHKHWVMGIRDNDLAQAVLETAREDEILQALGRLRLPDRTEDAPAKVYVMTSVPLPIVVDALAAKEDLKGIVHPLIAAMHTAGGVLPTSRALLTRAVGAKVEEFSTEGKAHEQIRKAGLTTAVLTNETARNKCVEALLDDYSDLTHFPFFVVRFRFKGQRGSDTAALIDANKDAKEALEVMLKAQGLELAEMDVLYAPPAAQVVQFPNQKPVNELDETHFQVRRTLNQVEKQVSRAEAVTITAIEDMWNRRREAS